MKRLNPDKLHVTDITSRNISIPRRYTLTHSDITGDLFLTIGNEYDTKQISKLYTRLMRDEVLAELITNGDSLEFMLYCHISGGLVIGMAKWRNDIFHAELPLVLKAIRYGDRILFETNPNFEQTPVNVYFQSSNSMYKQVEYWGIMADYK
ncbi:staygreen family protein [Chloroflexota bacterium]